MKKIIISLKVFCFASILLVGCGDSEAKQAKVLEFNEENYTYEEDIIEEGTQKQYLKKFISNEKSGGEVPDFIVEYRVVNDVHIAPKEYWHHPVPQGVITIKFEGDIEIDIEAVNELAKPIIDYMEENEMFHPEYGVDFVRTKSKYDGFFSNPLIYNNADDDDFEIKDFGSTLRYEILQ